MSTAVKTVLAFFIATGAAFVLIPEFRSMINMELAGILINPEYLPEGY